MLSANLTLFAQSVEYTRHHLPHTSITKCDYDPELPLEELSVTGDKWGYGYADLLIDLEKWKESPYVTIDSLGASVQNRGIWQLTITDTEQSATPKHTIFIHARTHPGEVQSWHVTDEIIKILISDNPYSDFIRRNTTFYIIPMYNPDGVELEYPRHNANDIDLEREWDKELQAMQPEAAILKTRFTELMNSETPIDIALNMHSAYLCKRYFVYHDAAGTSQEFAELEKQFITGVHNRFPEGIEPWYDYISWQDETPTHFPESWFWFNFGADVMALTYEDMNCETAGMYDRTADAIVHGILEYLELQYISGTNIAGTADANRLSLTHRIAGETNVTIDYHLPSPGITTLEIFNSQGELVEQLQNGVMEAGAHRLTWNATSFNSGVYFIRLQAGEQVVTDKCLLFR